MDMIADEILIAIFDRADFERATETIEGFERWASYEDYRCDREGRLIGLSFAGQNAKLALVSIDDFLDWSRSIGAPPVASRLDGFAARAAPRSGAPADGSVAAAVNLQSYRNWLECLGEAPSDALLDAYVSLVAEERTSSENRAFAAE